MGRPLARSLPLPSLDSRWEVADPGLRARIGDAALGEPAGHDGHRRTSAETAIRGEVPERAPAARHQTTLDNIQWVWSCAHHSHSSRWHLSALAISHRGMAHIAIESSVGDLNGSPAIVQMRKNSAWPLSISDQAAPYVN